MATRRANAAEPVFRLRLCVLCHALFVICRSCDRGQRYCNARCRLCGWWEQRRQANRRHQRSAEGRADHRDRQRGYRKRCAQRRWAALGGTTGESVATERMGNAQLRAVELSTPSGAFSLPALPLSPPLSQDGIVTLKNVTDKASATPTSSDMIAAGDSGSVPATPLRSSIAQAGQQRYWGIESGSLRCMICGRCGWFVDPFPPFHCPNRRLDFR
jgi:hypothetical protein